MKKAFAVAMTALVSTALTGCGGGADAPAPTGTLKIQNSTTGTISSFTLRPPGASTWGAERLSGSLSPTQVVELPGIPVGSYDARATASNAYGVGPYYAYYSIDILADALAGVDIWESHFSGSLLIDNDTWSFYDLIEVLLRPAGSESWGPNLLTSPIPRGESRVIEDLAPGTYDIALFFKNQTSASIHQRPIDPMVTTTLSAF